MRPLAGSGGGDSFWPIVKNLNHAVEYLDVSVRVNLDSGNVGQAEELLAILADEGLAGRIGVYPGQIVGVAQNPLSPSTGYATRCLSNPEFAGVALEFSRLAAQYGFGSPPLPEPLGAPCTAVRKNELVVGSDGELYKCWDSVGNSFDVIGHITDYQNPNARLRKWLAYDPFSDDECRSCIALPVCMGGCAHHAMDLNLHDDRCDTFRHNYEERVLDFVERAEGGVPTTAGTPVPVALGRRT